VGLRATEARARRGCPSGKAGMLNAISGNAAEALIIAGIALSKVDQCWCW